MSKERLTYSKRLRKMLKEAESDPVLSSELTTVQAILKKPRHQAVTELLKFLKTSLHQDTKWIICRKLERANDKRIIRPMTKAIQATENVNYSFFFLWALTRYDCTKHLSFFVDFVVKLDDPGEAMMVAIMIIRDNMKGPFEPSLARKCIRKLLAEIKMPMDVEMKLQTEAFRLEAADFIMAKYFNYTRKAFWQERKGGVTIS